MTEVVDIYFDPYNGMWWVETTEVDVGPFKTEEEAKAYFNLKEKE